jgi:hypothetical protein
MAGHDYSAVSTHLIRTELWSDQLKEALKDMLMGQRFVNWMSNFPDGSTFTIPSIGELPVRNVDEGVDVVYDNLDTGEFQFTIDKYIESATFITDKAKQDSYYADQLIASFVPKMKRAIEENVETQVFNLANSQTASDANSINGAAHRWIGNGTGGVITLGDFARAKFALDKANCTGSRVAVIDPSQEYVLNTLTAVTGLTNTNAAFDGIVQEGFVNSTTGMRFVKHVYGFDVYVSNYLDTTAADENAGLGGTATASTGFVQNVFMSIGGDETPFKGAWRQMPNVEYARNKDKRRDEYVMNARFGLKLYRPESLVCVLTPNTVA